MKKKTNNASATLNATSEAQKKKVNTKLIVIISAAVLLAAVVLVILFACRKDKGDDDYVEIPVERTTYIYGDFEYVALDGGNAKIVAYNGDGKGVDELVVPTAIDGKLVTEIGDLVFS